MVDNIHKANNFTDLTCSEFIPGKSMKTWITEL
jgi:hypothetical protein